jgi:peroxiredoxin (alkyl hydroperoxide reductase subunit C)
MTDDTPERETTQTRQHAPLQINGIAPDFEAQTTDGPIRLHDWNPDKWVVLFSHPSDFTPVCTTEFMGFAERYEAFQERGVELLGLSIDSVHSHIAWKRNIEENFGVEIPFPIIADLDQTVARKYGMLHEASSETSTVRTVFVIDPDRRIRAMVYYPLEAGRNMDEFVRLIDALQTIDADHVATPADWQPGDDVILPPPETSAEADERMKRTDADVKDWYFSTIKQED